jgi:hypothetical protein
MRRDKIEAVLPPLRTLAAYATQKIFISLDGCGLAIGREKFLSLSGKRGGFSLLKRGSPIAVLLHGCTLAA